LILGVGSQDTRSSVVAVQSTVLAVVMDKRPLLVSVLVSLLGRVLVLRSHRHSTTKL
jgi:hypothetical protein